MRLSYTEEAIADLERLRAFIAEHDPKAAVRVALDLLARIERLCEFPLIGHTVAEAPDPEHIRDFAFSRYVVRYLVSEKSLCILRIWHHREDRARRPRLKSPRRK